MRSDEPEWTQTDEANELVNLLRMHHCVDAWVVDGHGPEYPHVLVRNPGLLLVILRDMEVMEKRPKTTVTGAT